MATDVAVYTNDSLDLSMDSDHLKHGSSVVSPSFPPLVSITMAHGPCQHSPTHKTHESHNNLAAQNKKPVFSLGKPCFNQPFTFASTSCQRPTSHLSSHPCPKQSEPNHAASWRHPSDTSPYLSRANSAPGLHSVINCQRFPLIVTPRLHA
jgi:hypothetical protein